MYISTVSVHKLFSNTVSMEYSGAIRAHGQPDRRFTQKLMLVEECPRIFFLYSDSIQFMEEVDLEAIIQQNHAFLRHPNGQDGPFGAWSMCAGAAMPIASTSAQGGYANQEAEDRQKDYRPQEEQK
ncbi:hypothetical protein ACTXT7_017148 [Hymenolepis weldensis]